MSRHCGYVVKIENLRPHSNADRLQVLTVFGLDTCVGLDVKIGDMGIYFPTDLQLSVGFCEANNLVRKKDEAGNNIGGYLDPDKRNVGAIRLRGERSEGIYLPLFCLEYTGANLSEFKPGDVIDVVNGKEICCKYIPRKNTPSSGKGKNKDRLHFKKADVAPLFSEHADTEQLAYNLSKFKPGDELEVSLKMHGTSQRTGYLPVFKGYKNDWWGRVANGINPKNRMSKFVKNLYARALEYATPIYDWGYVSGTRRTVLENYEGGYYGSNEFREEHSKMFEGKLWKGETVYYEVVGFTHTGTPIMSSADNKKLNDKEFVKQYGPTTVFSYGCSPVDDWERGPVPQSDIYVYRMTMTNIDGDVIEYTPDFMRYRCEQMGVKTVPVFFKGHITRAGIHGDGEIEYHISDGIFAGACYGGRLIGDMVKAMAEEFYAGPDPIGKTHIREGVVVRIINRPTFTAFKHKNFEFKVLENIVKVDADAPDMEEAQEVDNA